MLNGGSKSVRCRPIKQFVSSEISFPRKMEKNKNKGFFSFPVRKNKKISLQAKKGKGLKNRVRII